MILSLPWVFRSAVLGGIDCPYNAGISSATKHRGRFGSLAMDKIPYREGEPSPGGEYVLVDLIDHTTGESLGRHWVLRSALKESPPRHANLDELLPPLRWIWRHLKPHIKWCRSFEDWELGFLRDQNPESEIVVWIGATYAYLEFIHRNPNADRDAVYAAIAYLMVGQDDMVKPKSVAKKLHHLAKNVPPELRQLTNFAEDGQLTTQRKHLC